MTDATVDGTTAPFEVVVVPLIRMYEDPMFKREPIDFLRFFEYTYVVVLMLLLRALVLLLQILIILTTTTINSMLCCCLLVCRLPNAEWSAQGAAYQLHALL